MQHEIDRLLALYEQRSISRRALMQALAALALSSRALAKAAPVDSPQPLFQAHTMNHVTIDASDVARSKAFYQRLAGLAVRDEAKDFCEFRLKDGFLGLYATAPGQPSGFNHFCLGIDNYDAKRTVRDLERAIPDAHPTIEYGDQVYVQDPDGVRVQLADVSYKT
jgi:catechol 2,3-dioxygenase-like lactoylglutathione lyase family enzyme